MITTRHTTPGELAKFASLRRITDPEELAAFEQANAYTAETKREGGPALAAMGKTRAEASKRLRATFGLDTVSN